MKAALRVLLVEDSSADAELLLRELRGLQRPIEHARVDNARDMRAALGSGRWDAVLSDWSMPGFSGLEALRLVEELGLDIPFIIVSGTVGEEVAVEAIKAGALDYVLKDKLMRLPASLDRALRECESARARRQTEEELRRSEERYRALFEQSPLPMWTFDVDTLAFLGVNEAAIRHYGYSREEFSRMTLDDVRPEEDLEALHLHLSQPSNAFDRGTWRHRKKDGSLVTVEVHARDLKVGRRNTCLALLNDVTERKKLEEQLRQAQKMEAIGSLASGIAHDFNNLLTVVLSYAEFLLMDSQADMPGREEVEQIQKAGQRAAALTRQLLLFSRQQVCEPKILNVNDVLNGVNKMVRRIIGEDVALELVLAPSLSCVRVDPGNLEQVIMNLVVNARDAMPTGGTLRLETAEILLDEPSARPMGAFAGPHVELVVSDTGAGMDGATQARIFEPFFTTKERGKGTGLGLSTVFGIVHQSRGGIRVHSEPGKGSTFTIYLPTEAAPADEAPKANGTHLSGSETILLVEDEDQVRRVAFDVLKRHGYQVLEARDAREALRICEAPGAALDLLLSDVVMPEMSGPELARRVSQNRPRLKVLCMSGYTDETVLRHGILGAGIAFVQKPLTPEMLLRKVRDVLDVK